MPKFLAPLGLASMTIDNLEYTPDEDGFFVVDNEDHQRHAAMHGAVAVTAEMEEAYAIRPGSVAAVLGQFDGISADEAKAKDDRIAELEALLAEKGAPAPTGDADATDAATEGASATGDTSSDDEGGADEDKVGAALADGPNFVEMGRDEMVDWLHSVGVMIPGNVSKEAAAKAIDEVVAEHNAKA